MERGKMIYLDNAATTKPKAKVKAAINTFLSDNYANPLSPYEYANESKEAVDGARATIADILDCAPSEIYFTSGGSESNSWAIKGLAFQYFAEAKSPLTIITTPIEHHSVLHACQELELIGIARFLTIPVHRTGHIDCEDLDSILYEIEGLCLVSIGWANNEIGTIQDMARISEIVHKHKAILHSDAVQAYGKIPIDISLVDMMSVSAHKWGAPKGIGFLYIRNEVKLMPLISGGEQENGLRGGTHNVPYIHGMAIASQLAAINMDKNYAHEWKVKCMIMSEVLKALPKAKVNGSRTQTLPNILNLSFAEYGVRGEQLVTFLSEHEIYVSTGSACNSASNEPSHVLMAIGLSEEEANSSIRMSFNENTTIPSVPEIVDTIVRGVKLLGTGA